MSNDTVADDRIEFLRASIVDIQGTIRALDAKAGWFLGLLLLPLVPRSSLPTILQALREGSLWTFWALVTPWAVAMLLSFLVLGAIADPIERIQGNRPTGSFFGSTLFTLRWPDMTPWTHSQSKKTVEQAVSALPASPDEVLQELAYEQLKLVFIRDTKFLRLRWAHRFLFVGLLVFMGHFIWATMPHGG